MTRSEWFTIIQDFLAKRMADGPDEDCRMLAEELLLQATDTIDDMPDAVPGIDEDEPE
jgi:hypothetical protein